MLSRFFFNRDRIKFKNYVQDIIKYIDMTNDLDYLSQLEFHVELALNMNKKFKLKKEELKW